MFEVRFLFEYRKRSKQDVEAPYSTVELWISKSNMKMQKKECSSVITVNVAAAPDRTKITDRQAVHLLAATAHGIGNTSVRELTPSRSSVRRARKLHRVELVTDIKNRFVLNVQLTVDWGLKLLPDITGREKVDRLPVLVSGVVV